MKDFRDAWKLACQRSGCAGKYFHDLRRTAARNMIRAGIPERVVIDIIGHKTRAMLDRYHIRNTSDLQQTAEKITGILPDILRHKSRPESDASQERNP
jgi:integrase